MRIGIIADPLSHPDWPQMEAYLNLAAKIVGADGQKLDPMHMVWAVYDGPVLMAATTARLTFAGFGEVVLVGGKDHRLWIKPLDEMIGRWMRDEGMASMRAYGRKGWARVLTDWEVCGVREDGLTIYERAL